MKKRTQRLLSNPFDDDVNLSVLFEHLNLQPDTNSQSHTNDMDALARLEAQMAALVATNTDLTQKLNRLETTQATFQAQQLPTSNITVTEYTDVVPVYTNGTDIQLDAFKVIHDFNGDRKVYRSWRTQVSKMMKQIENFKTHPKYAAALAIIRAKITGVASDILINNNTAHDIDAIIDRLDFSYADQRPLYVIEAEMTTIRQHSKTLQEFYDSINQALNMVLTKIAMTYKEAAEQKSLVAETQSKAVRTFITGLNSPLIRTTLYGNMPNSLSRAFAIAQTIQYDNQHLHLENKMLEQQRNMRKPIEVRPNSNPNFRYQSQQPNSNHRPNQTAAPQHEKPTPMEIDRSGQFIQTTKHSPIDFQQMKRQREPSFQYVNKQPPSFQHVNKHQRVNHVDETNDIQSVYNDSLENNCDTETHDSQSIISEQGSVFLEE